MPTPADAILNVRPSPIRPSPTRSPHIVYLLALPLATTLLACGSDTNKNKKAAPTSTVRNCRPIPPPAAQPITWVPADLPLPDRTYAVSDAGASADGVHHG